jgi:rhamnogalacturonyl hydrolase YesR
MKPFEVLLLPPASEADLKASSFLNWQCLMVEYGVDFGFNDGGSLPDRLPDQLDGLRLVLGEPDALEQCGPRLEQFQTNGGYVTEIRYGIQEKAKQDMDVFSKFMSSVTNAGVTRGHPNIRHRLQNRRFRELLDEWRPWLKEKHWTPNPSGKGWWEEPHNWGVLQAMEAMHEADPNGGWMELLQSHLSVTMAKPDFNAGRLFGTETILRLYEATWDSSYIEFARNRIEQNFKDMPRLYDVLQPIATRHSLLWNEGLMEVAGPAAAYARVIGDEKWLAMAIALAVKMHELVCCPELKLWYQAGRPGWRTPAVWARGNGWALVGLTSLLRNMPTTHPKYGLIKAYVEELISGLQAAQDDEGLWHNVMEDPRSRTALRASSQFVWCLSLLRRQGHIAGETLDALLEKAWKGIRGRMWKLCLCSNCWATGTGDYQYYMARPVYFTGSAEALRAGAELVLAFGDDDF